LPRKSSVESPGVFSRRDGMLLLARQWNTTPPVNAQWPLVCVVWRLKAMIVGIDFVVKLNCF